MNRQMKALTSGCLISAISATFFLVLPLAIGAISNQTEYGEQFLGLIATIYLFSFTIAGVLSASISPKVDQRLVSLVGFLLLISGFFLTAVSLPDHTVLLTGIGMAGLGAGILYSVSFRIIGLATNLERAYGLKLFTEQILAATIFFIFAYLALPFSLLMKSLAGIAFLFMSVIVFTPKFAFIERDNHLADTENSNISAVILSIFAVVLFMFAMTGPWTFLEPLSQERSLDPKLFGTLGAISLLLGGVGGGIAAIQGKKYGLQKPLFFSIIIAIGIYAALMFMELPGFIIFILIFPLLWNYALAFQFSITSQLDKQNRYSGWLAPAVAIGATGGPIFAGTILENTETAMVMILVAGLLSSLALLISAKTRKLNSR